MATSKTIFILNGPNLNLLGARQPEIYGSATLAEIEARCAERAQAHGRALVFRQSNSEAELIGWIQEAGDRAAGLILNPAAYGHTSIALLDAMLAVAIPKIELHLSNPGAREAFRAHSYITRACDGVIAGFGAAGYLLALDALIALEESRAKG